MASLSWADYGPSSTPQDHQSIDYRLKKITTRQLLSCTTCRERKVKCDRTKPCSACCARGHPKECEFVVGEGNDYSPIQQSYEIRKLRLENQRLKERLQAVRQGHPDDDEGEDDVALDQRPSRSGTKPITARQRSLRTIDHVDNIYFGTPGLASIVSDFANLQLGAHSLTHTVPKGRDLYAADSSPYPFPIIFNHSTSSALLELLPPKEELLEYLDLFQRRAQPCVFPFTPEEVTKKEVERFLSDAEHNAETAPDVLALIFATLATGLHMGQYDRNGGKWNAVTFTATRRRQDAFLAASMQALRNASFMNMPTLPGIQTLVMMGPYLTNTGRFLDAWTLFGTTIRLAHSIGLHRNPKFLDPVPPLPECSARQALWWWMLHMDQQYSVTLGRPLGISGTGDCTPPEQLTTNPTMLRLSEFTHYFTILARLILSSNGMMTVTKIDEYTDKLLGLWDTMPSALQFDERWVHSQTMLPEWPMDVLSTSLFVKVQSFLTLLNRQRIERTQGADPRGPSPPSNASATINRCNAEGFARHPAPVRGRALVINSCLQIIKAFMFFKHRHPALLICWTTSQQAFNACMILLLDAWETNDDQHEWLIAQAYTVFRELDLHKVHSLAELAVNRISGSLLKLGQRREERARLESTSMSRCSSSSQQPYSMPFDNAACVNDDDWPKSTVMGTTGVLLLEDPGLQSYIPHPFQPLNWNTMDSNKHHHQQQSDVDMLSDPISNNIPVSEAIAAPFPLTSTPTLSAFLPPPPTIPVRTSPFSLGLQPRMPLSPAAPYRCSPHQKRRGPTAAASTFTPVNDNDVQMSSTHFQPYPSPRDAAQAVPGSRPRGGHRYDGKSGQSLQRR